MAESIHELRITLRGTSRKIWRRVAVPSTLTLGQLHEVIQIAMGWSNSHLHMFVQRAPATHPTDQDLARAVEAQDIGRVADILFDEETYGPPGYDLDVRNEHEAVLADVCTVVKSKLDYAYDLGDDWKHLIEVVKVHDAKPGIAYPVCLSGRKACPPEDCGGIDGYRELLEALADRGHERHAELIEWIGAFDADAFDRVEVNEILKDWREMQPRVHR